MTFSSDPLSCDTVSWERMGLRKIAFHIDRVAFLDMSSLVSQGSDPSKFIVVILVVFTAMID